METTDMLKELAALFHGFADSLQKLADAAGNTTQPTADAGSIEDYELIVDAETEQPAETEPTVPEKQMTFEEVRAVLAEKSRAGHTAEVRALIKKHGANKLSEIDPKNYAALLADVEAI